jgi:hypothetical protein
MTAATSTADATNNSVKNIGAATAQTAAQMAAKQRNAVAPRMPMPPAIFSRPATTDQIPDTTDGIADFLPTTDLSAAKTIPTATAQVSNDNGATKSTVAGSTNLLGVNIVATVDPTAPVSVADDTITVITANAIATATETTAMPTTEPIAPTSSMSANPSAGKAVAKTKSDAAETAATTPANSADPTVAEAKTGTVASVPANHDGAAPHDPDDSKVTLTSDEKSADMLSSAKNSAGTTTTPMAALTPVATDGTSTANQDDFVGGDVKANKNEGSTGQILPGSGVPELRGNDLPVRTETLTPATASIAATQKDLITTTTAEGERVENPAVTDLNLQTMERTHELVALHAMRLSEMNTGTMQVVIKPEAGTQLSLELRQRGNGVEAQAVLQQGDFKHLNQHWPELQQRLEQRGIKLASLTDNGIAGNSHGGGGGRFEPKQNQSVETFAGYASTGSVAGTFTPVKPRVTTHAGWETWA